MPPMTPFMVSFIFYLAFAISIWLVFSLLMDFLEEKSKSKKK